MQAVPALLAAAHPWLHLLSLASSAFYRMIWAHTRVCTGVVQPMAEIGRICRAHKVFFHTDAAQVNSETSLHLFQEHNYLIGHL